MVRFKHFLRATVLLAASVVLAGCASLSTLWQQTFSSSAAGASASTPPPELEKIAKGDGKPPQPAPALLIPGPAPAAEVALAPNISLLPATLPETNPAPLPGFSPIQGPAPGNLRPPEMPPRDPVAAPPAAPAKPQPVAQVPQVADTPPSLREIYRRAAQKFASMESYIMRLRRREGGPNRPEELILCKFRQEPWSVYMKWLSAEGRNREVIYVKGRNDNMIHTLLAAGDIPLIPAGRRMKISVDSPLVRARSRYPITEAGIGRVIERFGTMVDAAEKGLSSEGTVRYAGKTKRPEFEHELLVVQQVLGPGIDPNLRRGGVRWWYFDPVIDLPVLIITLDENNREVEFYCHDRIQFVPRLPDDDFNPDKLWPPSR